MSCHAGWDREQLLNAFGKRWVSTSWKVHRENLLFERERGMMPSTQIYMIWQEELGTLNSLKNELGVQVRKMEEKLLAVGAPYGVRPLANHWYGKEALPPVVATEARAASQAYHSIKRQMRDVKVQIHEHVLTDPTLPPTAATPPPPALPRLAMPCPAADCMGFVLQTTWKCGMCGTGVCKDCRTVKTDTTHTCQNDDVLTAQALANESKPCPHCAVPTFRISGCSQMWCVVCHKPWSWKTGLAEHGVIHNPHYYNWRRQQQQQQQQQQQVVGVGVGADPDERHLIVAGAGENLVFNETVHLYEHPPPWRANPEAVPPLHTQLSIATEWSHRQLLETLYQRLAHLWVVERPKLLSRKLMDNMDLRIDYMRKRLTEVEFKRKLQQREKKHEKFTEYAVVITAHCIQVRNRLREMIRSGAPTYIDDLVRLWAGSHKRIETIAKKYDAVPPDFFTVGL
jgi:hypothetical protein